MEDDIVLERNVRVALQDRLHARPASPLVRLAKRCRARNEIERDGLSASARSSVKLMLLAVRQGEDVLLKVAGDDAAAALDAVVAFLASAGEADAASPVPTVGPQAAAAPATAPRSRRASPRSAPPRSRSSAGAA